MNIIKINYCDADTSSELLRHQKYYVITGTPDTISICEPVQQLHTKSQQTDWLASPADVITYVKKQKNLKTA